MNVTVVTLACSRFIRPGLSDLQLLERKTKLSSDKLETSRKPSMQLVKLGKTIEFPGAREIIIVIHPFQPIHRVNRRH
jgi:hypothetical protein